MQENRSFDHYFGTFPGANGFPAGTCVPLDPANPTQGCIPPFYDPNDINAGAPHGAPNALADIDDGVTTAKQDGYVLQQSLAKITAHCIKAPNDPACAGTIAGQSIHDAMGYHDARDIPNYWSYAATFVLQDAMFAGVRSWSLPSHLDLTSEWVANCTDNTKASTCTTASTVPKPIGTTRYPWANVFDLLNAHNVNWRYYLGTGNEPDCEDDEMSCNPQLQTAAVPSIWNPLPYYSSIRNQGLAYQHDHIVSTDRFLADINHGTLRQVSWIVPNSEFSEHAPGGVTAGMEYVTSLVNAIMASPYWQSTAIFVAWDDWGGFYDHYTPPNVDTNSSPTPVQGFGIRVPGLMISAYARHGYIDHSVYSFDSYAKFVEDLFMGGARLDPAALGNPDSRPTPFRDALTTVTFMNGTTVPFGNLMSEFDFTQKPLPPLVLSTHIPTGITTNCAQNLFYICAGNKVTISWVSVTGPQVPGPFIYHLLRDDAELTACAGTTTTCTDQPPPGEHVYRVYSVASDGTRSPNSAGAVAYVTP